MDRSRLWRILFVLELALSGFALAPRLAARAAVQEKPVRIIFMHHSTGEGVIAEGGVREGFTALGYEFWDHGYNEEGLADASGDPLGVNWSVPDDNTDPDGWFNIFNQPVTDPPANTLSHMLEFDVIIFKSCFPNSDIQSEEQFEDYRRYFLSIRDVIDQHPDKLFIPFTTPPLVPNSTSPDAAARARRWAEYLTSDEYLTGHPNIAVFDFFSLLADQDGFLRSEYRVDESDSHPNELANRTVGPLFVQFVDPAVREFEPGMAPAPAQQPEVSQPGGEEHAMPDGRVLDDFETGDFVDRWWSYTNDGVKSFTCDLDQPGHEGGQVLRLTFDIAAGGSAGCGADLESNPAWAEAEGVRFYWRSDQPGFVLRVGLGVRDLTQTNPDVAEATPFEQEMSTDGDQWSQVTVRWSDLVKPEWVGDTGVEVFDPAQVTWIVFDVGYWDKPQLGSIWIDDLELVGGHQ
jgi:hypothetical protein